MCDGALPDGSDDAAMRRRYGELVKARQVQFVTFHQSYAYEDFVEGLRPTTGEGEEATGGFRLEPVAAVCSERSRRSPNRRARRRPRADLGRLRSYWPTVLEDGSWCDRQRGPRLQCCGRGKLCRARLGCGRRRKRHIPALQTLRRCAKSGQSAILKTRRPARRPSPGFGLGDALFPILSPPNSALRTTTSPSIAACWSISTRSKSASPPRPPCIRCKFSASQSSPDPYHEAVIDGYLIDHEPPIRIETELTRAGITFQRRAARKSSIRAQARSTSCTRPTKSGSKWNSFQPALPPPRNSIASSRRSWPGSTRACQNLVLRVRRWLCRYSARQRDQEGHAGPAMARSKTPAVRKGHVQRRSHERLDPLLSQ